MQEALTYGALNAAANRIAMPSDEADRCFL
jgi:hypothetical protein